MLQSFLSIGLSNMERNWQIISKEASALALNGQINAIYTINSILKINSVSISKSNDSFSLSLGS